MLEVIYGGAKKIWVVPEMAKPMITSVTKKPSYLAGSMAMIWAKRSLGLPSSAYIAAVLALVTLHIILLQCNAIISAELPTFVGQATLFLVVCIPIMLYLPHFLRICFPPCSPTGEFGFSIVGVIPPQTRASIGAKTPPFIGPSSYLPRTSQTRKDVNRYVPFHAPTITHIFMGVN